MDDATVGPATLVVQAPGDIAHARRAVLAAAITAGVDAERADPLAYATSEIVTNALVHGGGRADVRITANGSGTVVDVLDHGSGFTAGPIERPGPTATRGRGLWLAGQWCDEMEIASGPQGTRVRLTMAGAG